MGRVRENFINNLKQLLNKSFKIYYSTQNDFDVNVHLSIPKIINDKSKEIASIQSLVKDGLLTPEEARNLILPFFGLEE